MIDLLPTCLEIAETEASHHFGKSLLPILGDSNIEHREAVFCEGGFNPEDNHLFEVAGWIYKHKSEIQHEMPELVGKAQCVRTQKWSFIRRHHEQNELYDREKDPHEKVNILATSRKNDADILAITQDLQDRILEWLVQTSDVIPWQPDNRFPHWFTAGTKNKITNKHYWIMNERIVLCSSSDPAHINCLRRVPS